MTKPAVPTRIPIAILKRAIKALEYQAWMEAGLSQAPDLINEKDTQAWKDAQEIKRILREQGIRTS
jgi:hypothetical protein